MKIYTYQQGSNQYKKTQKSHGLEVMAVLGLTLYTSSLLLWGRPFHEDANTKFLKQFTFGQFPSVVIAAEAKIAGTSAQRVYPLTKQEMVDQSKHPNEINRIWEKETSKGKNTNPQALHNLCKAQGKSNEFGYGGMAMKICFDSFEESVKVVDEWLDKRTAENLCYYNLGVKTSNCEYVR